MEEKELINQEVEKEIQETDWKDSYLRLYADFDNYKKRVIKEKEEIRLKTKLETLQSVLEIDNDLHLAQKVLKDPKAIEAVKVITDKLSSFLKSKGFEEVQTETYDEDLHEVISVVTTGKEEIVDVVSKGWKLNGQVVKYSSIVELKDEAISNALLRSINGENRDHLKELMIDTCQSNLFSDSFWFTELDGDYPIEYVLPAVRKVFVSFFIQIPPILESDPKRVELFQLQFNLDEFLVEISNKIKIIERFSDFEHIDKPSTVLQLIVDNYVAGKIKMTRVDNLTQSIREIKLQKHLKI